MNVYPHLLHLNSYPAVQFPLKFCDISDYFPLSESDGIISSDYVKSMEPIDFELYCKEIIDQFAKQCGINCYKLTHNVLLKCHDGEYQIDLCLVCRLSGLELTILCECKHYKNPVKREKVQSFYQKVQSLCAHKAVFLSSSGFQKGAIIFAKEHGITLIRIYDYNYEFLSHSSGTDNASEDDPLLIAEKMMPPVQAYCLFPEKIGIEKIYPSREMVKEIMIKQRELLKEIYGIDELTKGDN